MAYRKAGMTGAATALELAGLRAAAGSA